MFYKPLLFPLLIQVALTFLVLIRMYRLRFAEMRRKQIAPQDLATRQSARGLLTDSGAAADNLVNQFEMPVLFYVAILLALTLMLQDPVIVVLAWLFVLLRAAHSLIHTTYNNVVHRFTAYILSTIALLGIWVRLAWYIIPK
jgi:hypothetical protein